MTEGGADVEGQYPEHYPSAARMDNRNGTRETSQETFRSILVNDLTKNSYTPLRREGNSQVGQYDVSGLTRNRRLEVLTYAVASGLQIMFVDEKSMIAKNDAPLEQRSAPHVGNKNKESGFDKTYEQALSTPLNVSGGMQVRGYDLTVENDGNPVDPEAFKATAKLLGWQVAWDANSMVILKRNTQQLEDNAA